jgi:hypothetical protein
MSFADLVGEIFLILLFLGLAFGVIISDRIRRKR